MNPLVEEPRPVTVMAVKQFGLAGLIVVAISTYVARWLCHSPEQTQQQGSPR